MAELKVTFKLSDRDVQHLRRLMRKASSAARSDNEEQIIKAALTMATEVRKFKPPQFVLERVGRLESLVAMVQDKQYGLPSSIRQKVISALCYFTHPADLIPDTIPGLGFLDDAILIELVTRELKHEMAAYQEFCRYRDGAEQRPWTNVGSQSLEKKLNAPRRRLRERVDERTARDAARESAGTRTLRIW